MKNTYEIIKFHETCGDKFFTIAITNKEGETHTDLFSEATLLQANQRVMFAVNEENEDLVNELQQLGFIEIAEEESEGKEIFDIYFHGFDVENGFLVCNQEGEYLKTYKTEKAANNFAAKQKYPVL